MARTKATSALAGVLRFNLIFFFSAAFSTPVHASTPCDILTDAVRDGIAEYKTMRGGRDSGVEGFIRTNTSCSQEGTELSTKLASDAAGLSCQAQSDAGALDQRLSTLGTRCVTDFDKIYRYQADLLDKLDAMENDSRYAVQLLTQDGGDPSCGSEIQAVIDSAKRIILLDRATLDDKEHSFSAKGNYAAFSDTAQKLQTLANRRGDNCGNGSSEFSSITAQLISTAKGLGAGIPKGTSVGSSSDVTGIEKARQLASLGMPQLGSGSSTNSKSAITRPENALTGIVNVGALAKGTKTAASEGNASGAPPLRLKKAITGLDGASLEILAAQGADKEGPGALKSIGEEILLGSNGAVGPNLLSAKEAAASGASTGPGTAPEVSERASDASDSLGSERAIAGQAANTEGQDLFQRIHIAYRSWQQHL